MRKHDVPCKRRERRRRCRTSYLLLKHRPCGLWLGVASPNTLSAKGSLGALCKFAARPLPPTAAAPLLDAPPGAAPHAVCSHVSLSRSPPGAHFLLSEQSFLSLLRFGDLPPQVSFYLRHG